MDPYWGQLNFLIFLKEDEIKNIGLIDEIRKLFGNTGVNIVPCGTADCLESKLSELDTPERKVIKFHAHGSTRRPGLIANAPSQGIAVDLLPLLENMINKEHVAIDFMSVCHQHEILLDGFRHLVTTSERLSTSVGHGGLSRSIDLYSGPFSVDRIPSICGKLGYYKVHY